MGMMPIGSLISGFLAEPHLLGPRSTAAIGGALALVGAAAFGLRLPAIRRELRPIYIQRGIMPAPDLPAQRALDTVVEESER
jgi:hypothetical protein